MVGNEQELVVGIVVDVTPGFQSILIGLIGLEGQ